MRDIELLARADSDLVLYSEPVAASALRVERRPVRKAPARAATSTIWFDYTDLVHYFAQNRQPTGIQRVQIELFRVSLLRPEADRIVACTFDPARRCWVSLPPALLAAVCTAAVQPDVPEGGAQAGTWKRLTLQLDRTVATAPVAGFVPGDVLVNVGSSWWVPNFMRYVRHQQRESGLLYAPFVHDCIPIKTPEYCSSDLVADFGDWFTEAMRIADLVLANSECTARDVAQVAADFGVAAPAPHVIRLDARFEPPARDRLGATVRARHGLAGPFALFVATVEARKNHIFVFQCWKRLVEQHGPDAVPDLVCVGKQGWLVEFTLNWLRVHHGLAGKVRLVGSVPDLDLAVLYRSAAFGVYCSHYEGWGLPVTETLSHGRAVLAPQHSSLPEAGGPFATYYVPDSADSFCEQATRLLDPRHRAALEAAVQARFRPRAWEDVLDQMLTTLRHAPMRQRADAAAGPQVELGATYSFAAARRGVPAADATRRGQWMQHGLGWWNSEPWGCWSRLSEAQLLFGLPPDAGAAVSLYLVLRGGPHELSVQAEIGHHPARVAKLHSGQRRLLRLPLDRQAGGEVLVRLASPLYGLADHTGGGDPREIGFGVETLAVIAADDLAGRCEFLEQMLMAG